MNVLVTGAAGFIGSNFVHHAMTSRSEWNVVALDLLTYAGNLENINSLLEDDRLRFVKADIADTEVVADLFSKNKFDLVFNFAAETHVDRSLYNPQEFVRTNVMGVQNLLSASMEHGVKRLVHISTDEVYGALGETGVFYEDTPLNPTSPYAASKASSDLMVLSCVKTHSFDAVVTRCTNNYGPYQFPEKLIPLFITNAYEDRKLPLYGDGMQIRSWVYVADHCEAVLEVAEKGKKGEVYNIGGGADGEIPNREVTEAILSVLGKPASLIEYVKDRPAHDRRYAVDCSKIKNELGWEATTPFHAGLERTVAWYLENREWWKKIKSGEYKEFYAQHYGLS